MLAGAGAVFVALGAYSAAQAGAATQAVSSYYSNGAAPTAAGAP